MMLLALGCSFRDTPVAVRERLAFDDARLPRALEEIGARYGYEAVILSTCNRVELYLARAAGELPPNADLVTEFLAEFHRADPAAFKPYLYQHRDADAVRHLFRVAASLDSIVIGEGHAHRLSIHLPKAGAAFDVGEEESKGAARKGHG